MPLSEDEYLQAFQRRQVQGMNRWKTDNAELAKLLRKMQQSVQNNEELKTEELVRRLEEIFSKSYDYVLACAIQEKDAQEITQCIEDIYSNFFSFVISQKNSQNMQDTEADEFLRRFDLALLRHIPDAREEISDEFLRFDLSQAQELMDAVAASLPEECAHEFNLYYLQKKSIGEIAGLTNLTQSCVEDKIEIARSKMHSLLRARVAQEFSREEIGFDRLFLYLVMQDDRPAILENIKNRLHLQAEKSRDIRYAKNRMLSVLLSDDAEEEIQQITGEAVPEKKNKNFWEATELLQAPAAEEKQEEAEEALPEHKANVVAPVLFVFLLIIIILILRILLLQI